MSEYKEVTPSEEHKSESRFLALTTVICYLQTKLVEGHHPPSEPQETDLGGPSPNNRQKIDTFVDMSIDFWRTYQRILCKELRMKRAVAKS